MEKNNTAQGAIEYLLIIGAAIIVVAIVVLLVSSTVGTADNENAENSINTGYDYLGNLIPHKTELLTLSDVPGSEEYALDLGNGTSQIIISFNSGSSSWESDYSGGVSGANLIEVVNIILEENELKPASEIEFKDHPCKNQKFHTLHPVYGCISQTTYDSFS